MDTHTISGTVPAIPTPLTRDGAIDLSALEGLLDHVFGSGVDGIVALGTSGEGMSLDHVRREMVLRAVAQTAGRGLLIAGCAGNSVRAVLEDIEIVASHGLDAVLVPPPYYYPVSDSDLISFYDEVAASSALPIVLYHIPARTKNALSAAAVRELAQHERIVGIKDSAGGVLFHLELLDLAGDRFSVMQGIAPLVAWSYLLGAQGAVTPVSALFPRLELALRSAIERSDLSATRAVSKGMNAVARIFKEGGMPLVTNLKAVCEILGYGERWTELPTPVASDEQLENLRTRLEAAGLLTTAS